MEDQDKQTDDDLYRLRHSLSHVLAQAVMDFRPGTKLGFGPPIADGFYYDFILPSPITEEDFPEIEKRMRHIIKQGQKFVREELPHADAMARLDEMREPYKREYAEELFVKRSLSTLSFYRNGPFLDMCEGPHVASTREIPTDCFKLRSVAGAYWRGESTNVMMTRLYAWAFRDKAQLEAQVKAHEDALARDHKKLGKELDIFVIDDLIGKGLPLWMPNGTVIRGELEKLMVELEFEAGFQRVATPHVAKIDLYYRTGHLPYFAQHMFPFMDMADKEAELSGAPAPAPAEGGAHPREIYCLKPMNCPHHHLIFAARKRSYKELPLRFAEYGQVYRYEDSGAVSGLLRVRGMSMNDAHIYCTKDQIEAEFVSVLEMHRRVYEILGLTQYHARFSRRDPDDTGTKYVDNPAAWEDSERIVRGVIEKSGLPFVEVTGEAAFYGPKIDFQFRSVSGREETASTVQLDFAVPERMDLAYVGSDNKEHRPYIIHRAPLGTHERFVALLIEHFGGAFPTWLAPVQVIALTVSERFNEYAARIVKDLRRSMIRAELEESPDSISKKIRNAAARKIPNQLVIGEREQADGTVTLRRHGHKEQRTMPVAEFTAWLTDVIRRRARE